MSLNSAEISTQPLINTTVKSTGQVQVSDHSPAWWVQFSLLGDYLISTLRVSACTCSVLCHYVLFSKANMLFCSTAYTTLFEWSHSVVSSVSYKTKQFANEVCSWTHIKRTKTNFFCCKVEVCCERSITFSIKIIWRVTNIDNTHFYFSFW